jgi:hypothetical protein
MRVKEKIKTGSVDPGLRRGDRKNKTTRKRVLLATGYWLLATGYWLLATGYWLLATGYWLLATFIPMPYWLLAIYYSYAIPGSSIHRNGR